MITRSRLVIIYTYNIIITKTAGCPTNTTTTKKRREKKRASTYLQGRVFQVEEGACFESRQVGIEETLEVIREAVSGNSAKWRGSL